MDWFECSSMGIKYKVTYDFLLKMEVICEDFSFINMLTFYANVDIFISENPVDH